MKSQKLFLALLGAIAVVLQSCAITTPPVHPAKPDLHQYYFTVKDVNDIPIDGVSITSTLYDHTERKIDTTMTTDAEGKAEFGVLASADTSDAYQNAFETKCEYSVFKIGYLPEYGAAKITYLLTDLSARGHKRRDESTTEITLYRVNDLISREADAIADTTEKNAILRFAEKLHRTFNSRGMSVPRHSVGIIEQDGKRYLSSTLNTPNVMNTDKLDSAGIAKTFFELSGREALELLREDADRMNNIDGFSITLTGTMKHFNDPGNDPVPVECRFLISRDIFQSVEPMAEFGKYFAKVRVFLDGREVGIER
ncbi:MAG: hypothetical protein ACHQQQ_10385 [Bacteroidota bacterium]